MTQNPSGYITDFERLFYDIDAYNSRYMDILRYCATHILTPTTPLPLLQMAPPPSASSGDRLHIPINWDNIYRVTLDE